MGSADLLQANNCSLPQPVPCHEIRQSLRSLTYLTPIPFLSFTRYFLVR